MLTVSYDNYAFIYHTYLCNIAIATLCTIIFLEKPKQHVSLHTPNSINLHTIDYLLEASEHYGIL